MNNKSVELGYVQKTLLFPLWGRARETQKEHPLLIDQTAVRIVNEINYDFSIIEQNMNPLSQLSWIARSIYFDLEIKNYLKNHPDGTIINIGCGLDTTYERIDNGKVIWFDLDLPDVIELRKNYIKETDRRKFISESVFGKDWYVKIMNKETVLILMGGVIYYFKEGEIKELFNEFMNHFASVDILFDYSSEIGMKLANKMVIKQGGMDKKANLVWGINDIRKMTKWDDRIEIVNNMPMFKEFKKNYPLKKRIGMILSDMMKIMSLCHIKIIR
ncbi:MAG: class I SAM-dependent methyltransferase [Spirochaetales bacterium]|nr:class I SAM-dependent methyltransferase [Spirochaetales bacterium]